MRRILVFAYGVLSYAVFFGTFLYAFGFVGNVVVPKAIASPAEVPMLIPRIPRDGDKLDAPEARVA